MKIKVRVRTIRRFTPQNLNSQLRSKLKWILIILIVVVVGIFLLSAIGKLFIQEIVQEVIVEQGQEKTFGVSIGQEAPHWELPDLEGNIIKFSDFWRNPFIVTFWTSWNSMSADQIKIFDEYLSQNTETIFKIVAINNQEDESIVSSFVQRGGYQVRILLDETGKVGELYKVRTLPVTYFLDKNGVIRDVFTGVLNKEILLEKIQKIIR